MISKFIIVCLGEVRKQKRNYYNSWSNFISLLLWPVLTFFITYYTYLSFDISPLSEFGIHSHEDLMIFLVVGALGFNSFFSMLQGAFQIINERQNGTLEIIYSTPANRMAMLYGRTLGGFFQSIWMFSIFFIGILLYNVDLTANKIFSIIASYVILLICSIIWGGFINVLFIITRDVNFLFSICDQPMGFFSGVKIPTSSFPIWAKYISMIFPLTYCLSIMRNLLLSNRTSQLITIIKLIISILSLLAITYVLSGMAEKINRRTGNLQLY